MNPLLEQFLHLALPLAAGVLTGLIVQKFGVIDRVARLTGMSSRVYSRAHRLLALLQIGVYLLLAMWCHPSNIPEVLAWFGAHPNLLPFQPTPPLVQGVFYFAVFFCGYTVILFPQDDEPQTGTNR